VFFGHYPQMAGIGAGFNRNGVVPLGDAILTQQITVGSHSPPLVVFNGLACAPLSAAG
jgi:hypothetical protein